MYVGRILHKAYYAKSFRFSPDPMAAMVDGKASKSRNRKKTVPCEIQTESASEEDVKPKLQSSPKSTPEETADHASPQVRSLCAVIRCVSRNVMLTRTLLAVAVTFHDMLGGTPSNSAPRCRSRETEKCVRKLVRNHYENIYVNFSLKSILRSPEVIKKSNLAKFDTFP